MSFIKKFYKKETNCTIYIKIFVITYICYYFIIKCIIIMKQLIKSFRKQYLILIICNCFFALTFIKFNLTIDKCLGIE